MKTTRTFQVHLGAIGLSLFLCATSVLADEVQNAPSFFGVSAVGADTLRKANGREGYSHNDAELSSVHGNNQANGALSGDASIGHGALAGFNGAAAVVVNSGHNAVVQVSQQIIFNLY